VISGNTLSSWHGKVLVNVVVLFKSLLQKISLLHKKGIFHQDLKGKIQCDVSKKEYGCLKHERPSKFILKIQIKVKEQLFNCCSIFHATIGSLIMNISHS
jgi:serine/threonine protein kinase